MVLWVKFRAEFCESCTCIADGFAIYGVISGRVAVLVGKKVALGWPHLEMSVETFFKDMSNTSMVCGFVTAREDDVPFSLT